MTTKPSNSGVIVALLPGESYTMLRPATADHHLTVAFLGRYNNPEITPERLEWLFSALKSVWPLKLPAVTSAETVFDTPDGWAYVDLIDSPDLIDFRCTVTELLEVGGLPLARDHGFIPHITKRYSKVSASAIEMVHTGHRIDFFFDRVGVWAGDERLEYDLV